MFLFRFQKWSKKNEKNTIFYVQYVEYVLEKQNNDMTYRFLFSLHQYGKRITTTLSTLDYTTVSVPVPLG